MRIPVFVILFVLSLACMRAVVAQVQTAEARTFDASRHDRETRIEKPHHSVRILPEAVSKSLKIQRAPTSRPVPLIIGSYWQCFDAPGDFEVCEPVLVVCTDDQSVCTQVP